MPWAVQCRCLLLLHPPPFLWPVAVCFFPISSYTHTSLSLPLLVFTPAKESRQDQSPSDKLGQMKSLALGTLSQKRSFYAKYHLMVKMWSEMSLTLQKSLEILVSTCSHVLVELLGEGNIYISSLLFLYCSLSYICCLTVKNWSTPVIS